MPCKAARPSGDNEFAASAATRVADESSVVRAELTQRTTELAVINTVRRALVGGLGPQEVYEAIGSKLREVFPDFGVVIRRYETATGLLHFPFWWNGQHQQRDMLPDKPIGFGAEVLRTGRTLLVNREVEGEMPRLGSVSMSSDGRRPRSQLVVPLMAGDEIYGMLDLNHPSCEDAFGEPEVRFVETPAASIGLALENARLFDETQVALQRQIASVEILRVINHSPNYLMPVFDAIVDQAFNLCAADAGGLWLVDGDTARYSGAQRNVPQQSLDFASAFGNVPLAYLLGLDWKQTSHMMVADIRDTDAYRARVAFFVNSVELGLIRTYLGVPMLDEQGRVAGVFTLVRREVRPFTVPQIALVKSFAAQAQLAMKNARRCARPSGPANKLRLRVVRQTPPMKRRARSWRR